MSASKDSLTLADLPRVDFEHPKLCVQSQPVSCRIAGEAITPQKTNWASLLVAIVEHFIAKKNPKIKSLSKQALYGNDPFFLPKKREAGRFHLLSNGKWLSTTHNTLGLVGIICKFLRYAEVDLNDIEIVYAPKDVDTSQIVPTQTATSLSEETSEVPAPVEDEIPEDISLLMNRNTLITYILTKYFKDGCPTDSLGIERFRNELENHTSCRIDEDDTLLRRSIIACGTLFSGMVYLVADETKERIKTEIEKVFSSGVRVIFYEQFYDMNRGWLYEAKIVSTEMFIDMFPGLYPNCKRQKNFFSCYDDAGAEDAEIDREIQRVWGDDLLLDCYQLEAKLPYIPPEKIEASLSKNFDYIRNFNGGYARISKVEIADEDKAAILCKVRGDCRAEGFATLADMDLGAVMEQNPRLSQTAILAAVFQKVLADEFVRSGKIITPKGEKLTALEITKRHCRSLESCSLEELRDFWENLTNVTTNQNGLLEAGYTTMVRVKEDRFVADKYVEFADDIDRIGEIDDTLESMIPGEYIPLQSVTTFDRFPSCGQVWNLFLLESFCRRFSERFRFDVLAYNSRNVGVIVRKNSPLSYKDILLDAVVKSDIPLTEDDVLDFLYLEGYLGRTHYAKIQELIDCAKKQRGME